MKKCHALRTSTYKVIKDKDLPFGWKSSFKTNEKNVNFVFIDLSSMICPMMEKVKKLNFAKPLNSLNSLQFYSNFPISKDI